MGPLRGLNLERVLDFAMDRQKPFTRAELIEASGLTAPTVGSLATHLIDSGLLRDLGTGPSRGGRRPLFMEFNARHGFVAGIDLGPTRTRLAVADLRAEPLAHRIIPTPSRLGPEALLLHLARTVRILMREAGIPARSLLAVGAGAPGAVDCERGTVSLAPNLKGWSDVPMRRILEEALGAPALVENDVNLALLGEHLKGAARGHSTCVFVHVGTGIGAGILVDGALHHGRHFLAGEIGAMCMGPQYIDVDFGSRGCLETLAGLRALAARWPGRAGSDPSGFVTRLLEARRGGNRLATSALEKTVRLIGMAVANVSTVVDPSLVVLGGALFAEGESLVDEVGRVVHRISRAPLEVAPSALGEEAPLAGSLLLAARFAKDALKTKVRESLPM